MELPRKSSLVDGYAHPIRRQAASGRSHDQRLVAVPIDRVIAGDSAPSLLMALPHGVARRLHKVGFRTISITRTTMRPDHTATEFAQTPSLLATPLESGGETLPQRQINAFARVTFCFAWLFGLEPFLTGSADERPHSRLDRH